MDTMFVINPSYHAHRAHSLPSKSSNMSAKATDILQHSQSATVNSLDRTAPVFLPHP